MRWKNISVTAVVATLGVLAWYVLRPIAPIAELPAKSSEQVVAQPESLPPLKPTAEKAPDKAPAPALKIEAPATIPAWEMKIDEALRSQAEHGAIAKSLLQQVPSMPPEGQHAAAQHIANLMADKDYLDVLPYIQNMQIAAGFQEVIVAESLNRPKEVKLPVLLAAARTPQHPMKDTALSVLSVLLDQNYGTDWTQWENAVQKSLKEPQN